MEKFYLKDMLWFVAWLRGMTTKELILTLPPKTFHVISANLSATENANLMVANDAILWKITGEYMKFLSQFVSMDKLVLHTSDRQPLYPPSPKMSKTHEELEKEKTYYEKAENKLLFDGLVLKRFEESPKYRIGIEIGIEKKFVEKLTFDNPNILTQMRVKDLVDYNLTINAKGVNKIFR